MVEYISSSNDGQPCSSSISVPNVSGFNLERSHSALEKSFSLTNFIAQNHMHIDICYELQLWDTICEVC